jgi:hypothetical protein
MKRSPQNRSKLERLKALAGQPDAQASYAALLIESEHDIGLLRVALAVVADLADPALRPVLLRAYRDAETLPSRSDPGCFARAAILQSLRPVAHRDDVEVLTRAISTYEFLPPGPIEVAAGLRAAALLAMNEVDDVLASYHAVRLLTDEHTSLMSGEPAVTAARLLAAQGELLPLYAYVGGAQPQVAEVTAECLRGLMRMPASLLPALVEHYLGSEDEIVLLGLFDLLLAPEFRASSIDTVLDYLQATPLLDIYRYLVSTIVAGRDDAVIARLAAMADRERNPAKVTILRAALSLR